MKAVDVSVVIPTYKHSEYVLQALESVFAQSFQDFEVIVVNDGSPDDTASVLRPLADAGKIFYVEQANAGQAAARNKGLSRAQGEFVAFLDDDDLWPPDKLAWQVEALRADSNICLVAGSAKVINDDGEEICIWNRASERITLARLCESNPMTSPGQTLIRRSALDAVGGLRPEIWGADDWDLYFRLAGQGGLLIQDRVALHYRMHGSNASHQTLRMVTNALKVLRENLPGDTQVEKRRLELIGTSTILQNYSMPLARKFKEAARYGEWRVAAQCLLALGGFWRLLAANPRLLKTLLLPLVPARVPQACKRLRRTLAGGKEIEANS